MDFTSKLSTSKLSIFSPVPPQLDPTAPSTPVPDTPGTTSTMPALVPAPSERPLEVRAGTSVAFPAPASKEPRPPQAVQQQGGRGFSLPAVQLGYERLFDDDNRAQAGPTGASSGSGCQAARPPKPEVQSKLGIKNFFQIFDKSSLQRQGELVRALQDRYIRNVNAREAGQRVLPAVAVPPALEHASSRSRASSQPLAPDVRELPPSPAPTLVYVTAGPRHGSPPHDGDEPTDTAAKPGEGSGSPPRSPGAETVDDDAVPLSRDSKGSGPAPGHSGSLVPVRHLSMDDSPPSLVDHKSSRPPRPGSESSGQARLPSVRPGPVGHARFSCTAEKAPVLRNNDFVAYLDGLSVRNLWTQKVVIPKVTTLMIPPRNITGHVTKVSDHSLEFRVTYPTKHGDLDDLVQRFGQASHTTTEHAHFLIDKVVPPGVGLVNCKGSRMQLVPVLRANVLKAEQRDASTHTNPTQAPARRPRSQKRKELEMSSGASRAATTRSRPLQPPGWTALAAVDPTARYSMPGLSDSQKRLHFRLYESGGQLIGLFEHELPELAALKQGQSQHGWQYDLTAFRYQIDQEPA